jgi:hypothetical protein|eukprot:CAMPEP_0169422818 /NCGR_PEP_ID=MMETSP1017-20121227/67160_1 /TAXON_ID=342587 /ORGANISM="Karlodinium micrum, Strain CCMP2283" /LENGTH=73 /DNA_ID=CAMNT_0009532461 /DNA_START=216 /DNA_END=437 /DNA_ORIENTATION=+
MQQQRNAVRLNHCHSCKKKPDEPDATAPELKPEPSESLRLDSASRSPEDELFNDPDELPHEAEEPDEPNASEE